MLPDIQKFRGAGNRSDTIKACMLNEHFEAVVKYIEENPVKAGWARLKAEWPWSSARFRIVPATRNAEQP